MTFDEGAHYLLSQDNILILTHKSPDGDTVGSAVALCLALRSAGKKAYLFKNPGFTKKHNVYAEALCAEDDYKQDLVCAVDLADTKLLPSTAAIFAKKIDFAVDHHASHRDYTKRLIVDSGAAACGEIIYQLILSLNVSITPEIAEALYVAISTDTSCFINSNTTSETHRITAELFKFQFDFMNVNRKFFVVKTKERIQAESRLLSEMHTYLDGRVAVITITHDLLRETQANEDDLNNIASVARSIEGVELGILIRERSDDETKISMRSSELVDVAKFCEQFGGGGHARAAGCSIPKPCNDAEKIIIDTIIEKNIL